MNIDSEPGGVPAKLCSAAVTAAFLAGAAFADPYSGSALEVGAGESLSYDSVTVDWAADAADEAGIRVLEGGTLSAAGDFSLTAAGAANSALGDQSGLLVEANGALLHTGQNFSIHLTTDSDTRTYQGAAYFGQDSRIELGSNAVVSASGSAENLWGVRLYGDLKGDALQITTANSRTPANPASEEGMSVGFWTEADAEIEFSKVAITASGSGFRTDGMMVHSTDAQGGSGFIDDLQIEAVNSAANGLALGLNFYRPQRESAVAFTMEGTRLDVKAEGANDATGISNRLNTDPENENITIRYDQVVAQAYAAQTATSIELASQTSPDTDTGIHFTAGESLKVVAESTEADAMGIHLINADLSAGDLDLRASGATDAAGVRLENSAWNVTGDAVIESTGQADQARALYVQNKNGEAVSFGKTLRISAQGNQADGIYLNKGKVTVGGDADITAKAAERAYGVFATGSTQAATFNGRLNVSAEGTNEDTAALRADISAQITATHGGTITSNHWAAYAYRGGIITLSSDDANPLNILGDVKADRTSSSKVQLSMGSGSTWAGNAEACTGTVAVTLKEGSLWTGDGYETAYNASSAKGTLGLQLLGGAWKLAGEASSTLSLIQSEGGTIDISSLTTENTLAAATLNTLAGETLFYTDTLHGAAVAEIAARSGADGRVGVVGSSSLNEASPDKTALVEALAEEVSIPDGPDFIRVEEGYVTGAVEGTKNDAGGYTVTSGESRNASDLRSALALRTRLLQSESAALPDRLALIRDGGAESLGGWVVVSGQELRYGATGAHSQERTLHAGFDAAVEDWVVGGSLAYTRSDLQDLAAASADGDTYVVSFYAQKDFESGAYVGAALRYLQADTDYQFRAFDADWKQQGWGLTVESGHRFPLADVAFVEPHASLAYAHLKSDAFESQNVRGEIKSLDMIIGGLGVRAGFTFPENRGSLYAKAAVYHDFDGDARGKIRSLEGQASADFGEDLGGTWMSYGIGGSFRISPQWNAALDLSRVSGNEVDFNWIASFGVRYVW